MSDAPHWLKQPVDFRDCRVTVMGLGAFGGGEGAVRFLSERGAYVTVTDLKSDAELAPAAARVAPLPGVTLRLGRHVPEDFVQIDLLVVNPAVPRDSPFVRLAVDAGVPLTSEMNLFWLHHRGRRIGVTGSNGKSTTATLLFEMLRSAGVPARLGGNIGRSLLDEVHEIGPDESVVLELSSFQLADLDHLRASPDVAVVTGFVPNHLDRHGSLDNYRHAKQTILRWQTNRGIAVLNADDADVREWPARGSRLTFGAAEHNDARCVDHEVLLQTPAGTVRLPLREHPALRGAHQRRNVAAAALAAMAAGAAWDRLPVAIETFRGLPHRLECVAERHGRWFYNDSKATTPEAALAALDSFNPRQPIVLLAGGSDKRLDLRALAEAICLRVKAAALMGETAAVLAASISSSRAARETSRPAPPFHCARSLREAFEWAVRQSAPGDAVLLSPGCASLDWFASYEERGRQFTALAREWDGEPSGGG